jgi:hypothetical protein
MAEAVRVRREEVAHQEGRETARVAREGVSQGS